MLILIPFFFVKDKMDLAFNQHEASLASAMKETITKFLNLASSSTNDLQKDIEKILKVQRLPT